MLVMNSISHIFSEVHNIKGTYPMRKMELIKQVADENEISYAQANRILNSTLSNIIKCVADGGEVFWPQFGKFFSKKYDERFVRNPKTGETMIRPAHRRPCFKIASKFKERVSGK